MRQAQARGQQPATFRQKGRVGTSATVSHCSGFGAHAPRGNPEAEPGAGRGPQGRSVLPRAELQILRGGGDGLPWEDRPHATPVGQRGWEPAWQAGFPEPFSGRLPSESCSAEQDPAGPGAQHKASGGPRPGNSEAHRDPSPGRARTPLRLQGHCLLGAKARPRGGARELPTNPRREARSRDHRPAGGFPPSALRLRPTPGKGRWHRARESLLARAAATACPLVGPTSPGAALRGAGSCEARWLRCREREAPGGTGQGGGALGTPRSWRLTGVSGGLGPRDFPASQNLWRPPPPLHPLKI